MNSSDLGTLRFSVQSSSGSRIAGLEFQQGTQEALRCSFAFNFETPSRFWKDLQWYMEDFLDEGDNAAFVRATAIRQEVRELGLALFHALFATHARAREIWIEFQRVLPRTRIEIEEGSGSREIPWELMRNPSTGRPVCLEAASFVRTFSESPSRSTNRPAMPLATRMLLVISRPQGSEDVEYRTIATTLFEGIRSNRAFPIEVLRPPTYAQCERVLRDAFTSGEPFGIVHFDGHGFPGRLISNRASEI
jgi:hypothetical protein